MNEILQCHACHESNQLPEGQRTMFCSFCGCPIGKKFEADEENESNRNTKPELEYVNDDYVLLELIDKNISDLDEIITSFSHSEIASITVLNLSNNSISSIDKISVFENLKELILDSNNISEIPHSDLIKGIKNIVLTNNPVKNSDEFIPDNCTLIKISQCPECEAYRTRKELSQDTYLCDECFYNSPEQESKRVRNDPLILKQQLAMYRMQNPSSGQKCFIATATMGDFEHPDVVELRIFRDEWILSQSWGGNFVTWYYNYGEKVAILIKNSLILKRLSYFFIVKPLVILSRILTK